MPRQPAAHLLRTVTPFNRTSYASKGLRISAMFELALPTLRRNHAHRRTNLCGTTVAPLSTADCQVRSMNRYPPSGSSRVHRHAEQSPASFRLQQPPAAAVAVRPALEGPASVNPQRSMSRTRVQNSAMTHLPASIGPFKLHKRPPPQRLPSSRCI